MKKLRLFVFVSGIVLANSGFAQSVCQQLDSQCRGGNFTACLQNVVHRCRDHRDANACKLASADQQCRMGNMSACSFELNGLQAYGADRADVVRYHCSVGVQAACHAIQPMPTPEPEIAQGEEGEAGLGVDDLPPLRPIGTKQQKCQQIVAFIANKRQLISQLEQSQVMADQRQREACAGRSAVACGSATGYASSSGRSTLIESTLGEIAELQAMSGQLGCGR